MARATVVPNTPEDHRGLANRVLTALAPLLARSKAPKSTTRPLHLVVKWLVNTILLLLLPGLAVCVGVLVGQLV